MPLAKTKMVIPDADGDADNDGGDTSGGHELDVFSGAAAFFYFSTERWQILPSFLEVPSSLQSMFGMQYFGMLLTAVGLVADITHLKPKEFAWGVNVRTTKLWS